MGVGDIFCFQRDVYHENSRKNTVELLTLSEKGEPQLVLAVDLKAERRIFEQKSQSESKINMEPGSSNCRWTPRFRLEAILPAPKVFTLCLG